jgi:hypothetical protein
MGPYRNFRQLEKLFGVTWLDLVEVEPELEELLWTARGASVICRRWADVDRLFSPIRNTLAEIVGFAGKNHLHRVLGTTKAYEVAYWKLYDAVAGLLPIRTGWAAQSRDETPAATLVIHRPRDSSALTPVAA